MLTLLERRQVRKAEKAHESRTPRDEAIELIDQIKIEMFVDIETLENTLVEYGETMYHPLRFRLTTDHEILVKLRELSLSVEDGQTQFHENTLLTFKADNDNVRIIDVMPSLSYVDTMIRAYLKRRGIGMSYSKKSTDWYKIDFHIIGDK